MKNKIICIVLCFVAVFASIFGTDMINYIKINRYHQHLEAKNTNAVCSHGSDVFCTTLPIIWIETEEGKPISGKNVKKAEQTVATIKFYDSETKKNHLTDSPCEEVTAKMRIRGNSSAHFDKSQYKISLVDENGKAVRKSLLNMGTSDDWVLGAPFLDKTLIRNYISYNIFGQICKYTPNVRFCEGYINGVYQGVYLLTESIQVGEEFVNIRKPKKKVVSTSYLLRIDRYSEGSNVLNDFFNYSGVNDTSKTEILYPTKSDLTDKQKQYIEKDLSYIGRVLYSYDYNDKEYGYNKLIDVDSFINYFLVNEVSQNYDAGIYSTYLYKDAQSKLSIGPLWDFNNAYDNYMEYKTYPSGFKIQSRPWFKMIMKDDAFVNLIIIRYKRLRQTVFKEDYIMNYIDETINYLGDAIDRNYEVWGYSFDSSNLDGYNKLSPEERNIKSYVEAINQLKTQIHERLKWLDKNIETLKMYSDDSANKRYDVKK